MVKRLPARLDKTATPRRMPPALAALTLAVLAALFFASSCDFIMSAFPQGYANAYFNSADPRIEASVLVKNLDEPFGLAVSPDGRVFVIDRAGVTEYDAGLRFVRRYLADPVAGIDKNETELGPEEWQVSATVTGETRLYGSRSGQSLCLFISSISGGTIFREKLDGRFYSGIADSQPFNPSLRSFEYASASSLTGFGFTNPAVLSYDPATNDLVVANVETITPQADKTIDYSLRAYWSDMPPPNNGNPGELLTLPSVPDGYGFGRLYYTLDKIVLAVGYGNDLHEYRSSTFAYERGTGGEPIARFDTERAVTAPSDEALYVLARRDDASAWLYRMRWLP